MDHKHNYSWLVALHDLCDETTRVECRKVFDEIIIMNSKTTEPKYKVDTGLRVRPLRDENLSIPKFEKPNPIGYFSLSTERNYEPTARKLRYYKQPTNYPLLLNEGLWHAIKRPEAAYNKPIDNLLKFIYDHKEQLLNQQDQSLLYKSSINAEFICWRSLFRLLMCTPYEFQKDWCIHVTKYMGSFYLCRRDTEYDKNEKTNETPERKTIRARGHKFEQLCLAESPFIDPDPSAPIDECAKFVCVYKMKLNDLKMLYGSQMDGIISEQPVQLDEKTNLKDLKFVEIKVTKGDLNPQQQQNYNRYKTRDWWCQSFLVGIKDIYLGLRNDEGLVRQIKHLEVRSLPQLGVNYWTPTACADFLIKFLTTLREVMVNENCPYTTYEFYFNSNTSRVTYECMKGKTEHSFLPDWYIEMLQ